MLVIQAIPLSLSILWRYVLTFPILLIGLFLYGFAGGVLGFLIGLIFPAAYFLILFFISASSGIIPVLVGTRFGFQSRHIRPSVGYKKLILPALAYGSVEALSIAVVLVLTLGVLLLLGAPELVGIAPSADSLLVATLQSLDSYLSVPFGLLMLVVFLAVCVIRACLLVPIASASIGRDPDNSPYTPFRNFGTQFWPLLTLVALSYVAMVIICGIILLVFFTLGADDALLSGIQELGEMIDGTTPLRAVWPVIALTASYYVVWFWTFSLQCAGGVLGHLNLGGGSYPPLAAAASQPNPHQAPQPSPNSGPRMSAEDLRALRKSRQTGGF